jgi:hypothetical protein
MPIDIVTEREALLEQLIKLVDISIQHGTRVRALLSDATNLDNIAHARSELDFLLDWQRSVQLTCREKSKA